MFKRAIPVRSCLGAALATGLLALIPATALATSTGGTATDPAGDSLGAPSQDITGATAQYESSGGFTVTATMNGNIAAGPASHLAFNLAWYVPPASCTGATASLNGYSNQGVGISTLSGASTNALTGISVSENKITFTTFALMFAQKSFSCMQVYVTSGSGQVLDQLNAPLWFDGYGPTGSSGGSGGSSTPGHGTGSSPGSGTTTGKKAPTLLAISSAAAVKLSTGAGALTVRCGAPATELCTFKLTLYASVRSGRKIRKVNVGTVTGRARGGSTARLTIKLNATGRKLLRRGQLRVEARGSITSTAGGIAQIHRAITLKKK